MTRLSWGLIGGGRGSQIGPVHRIAAIMDGAFTLAAGALDVDREEGRAFAAELGIVADRAHGDWRAMLDAERRRPDRLDLVTVATPNATHFEIARAYLADGFNVLCEKPMTMTVPQAREIVRVADASGAICAVNYGYSGFPLARQMRSMVASGALGRIRLVFAEFAHGHHAAGQAGDNDRIRWRYDPAEAGASAVLADAGIHALHLACFVTGQEIEQLSADFCSCVEGRVLEDDAMVNARMSGGAICRLWTSAIATGRQHGLTLQVFGEKGGLRWAQEQPNQLFWTPQEGATQILERGAAALSPDAQRASRVNIGHSEGMTTAFANIYTDLAAAIRARKAGLPPPPEFALVPSGRDGLRSVATVDAAVRSARDAGVWIVVRPNGVD